MVEKRGRKRGLKTAGWGPNYFPHKRETPLTECSLYARPPVEGSTEYAITFGLRNDSGREGTLTDPFSRGEN